MELELIRSYFPEGTNGTIYLDGKRLCSSIELPWLNNKRQKSCIPEGRYELTKRYSEKYKEHLLVKDVPGRDLILFHPANIAKSELKGCIAPVSILLSEGVGLNSKKAMNKLLDTLEPAFERKETVFITIKSSKK